MKAETTRPVAMRAILPLFFVHSTLRNFILCFHLHPLLSFLIATENLLLVRVTLWKLAWYYHKQKTSRPLLYCSSATIADVDPRTFFHTSLLTLHFLFLPLFFPRRFLPVFSLLGRRLQ